MAGVQLPDYLGKMVEEKEKTPSAEPAGGKYTNESRRI